MDLFKKLIFIILLLSTSISYAKHVKILVVAIHGIETAKLEWQPTVDHLQSSLPQHSFSLIPFPPNDLAKIKNVIVNNEIDFVISQPAIYIDLEMNFGVSRILTMVKEGGLSEFGSTIITRADSGIGSIDELKGKTIAGVAKLGFGGWLIGYKEMLDHGFEPYTDAKKVTFLGTQPTEVNAVLEGNVDAAVIRTGVLEMLSKKGKVNLADFRVLSPKKYPHFPFQVSTPLYPEWAFAKTTKVSNDLSKSVALSLLSNKNDSKTAQKAGYLKWTFPYDYQPVHKLLQELQVGPYKHYGKISTINFIKQHQAEFIIFLILIAIILIMSITIYRSNLILSKGKLEKEKLLEHIKNSQKQYKEAQEQARLGHWVLDLETHKLHWSDEIYRIFELNAQEFEATYEAFVNIIHPDDREFVKQAYTDSIKNRMDYDIEHRLLMKDGQIKYVHERCETEYDDNGKPLKSMGTVLDITDRRLTELALQESNDKFRALTETTHDFIWEVTADGVYTYCSPQSIDILGYRPEELLGKRPMDIMSQEEAERVAKFFNNAAAQQAPIKEFENINLTKDSQEVILETSAQPFFSITGELLGYRGIDRDITQRKQAEIKLQHMAHHDPLTGLANRRQLITDFEHESKRAGRYGRKMAFFYLDLNRFKTINDTLGHEVGDNLLIYIAEQMSNQLRESDNIYRVGGDEFNILIPEFNDKEQLKGLADRIIESISSIKHFSGTEIDIGCSIGIAIFPDNGKTLSDLTSSSDNAMYLIKRSDKVNYCFDD